MTAKLVVLLTKSEVTHGMIDILGVLKFLYNIIVFSLEQRHYNLFQSLRDLQMS